MGGGYTTRSRVGEFVSVAVEVILMGLGAEFLFALWLCLFQVVLQATAIIGNQTTASVIVLNHSDAVGLTSSILH